MGLSVKGEIFVSIGLIIDETNLFYCWKKSFLSVNTVCAKLFIVIKVNSDIEINYLGEEDVQFFIYFSTFLST